jgi:predicted metal-dependent TIM-barrel fold hydrolase
MYPVIGIPPSGKMDPKILDETLVYLEEYVKGHKIFGVGEIGMGRGTKEEYTVMKRQLKLAGKYDMPVIIQAPTREKVAFTSIILKEMKKSNVNRAIFTDCDKEILQLVIRANNKNIKAAITVGKTAIAPIDALKIYKNYSYDDRICLMSGLGLRETSLFGLIQTIELFAESIDDEIIHKLCYSNYLDVFPSISVELRKQF